MRRKYNTLYLFFALMIIGNVGMWFGIGLFEIDHRTVNDVSQNEADADFNALLKTNALDGMKEDVISGMLGGLSDPSLEMRENVDFLLTPAIIVQECITEGVIVIYPEE